MKLTPLKRTIINTILFAVVYGGVTFLIKKVLDWKTGIILLIVYFVLNYVVLKILDKASKD